jgi:hypothetical protein
VGFAVDPVRKALETLSATGRWNPHFFLQDSLHHLMKANKKNITNLNRSKSYTAFYSFSDNIIVPSLTSILKSNRHFILHYIFMQQMRGKESSAPINTFSNSRHRYFFIIYYKSFQLISRLKGEALSNI